MSTDQQINDPVRDDALLRFVFYFGIGATTLGEAFTEKMTFRKNKSPFWRRHYDESSQDVDGTEFEVRQCQVNCWSMRRFEALKAAQIRYNEEDCQVTVLTSKCVSLDEEINDFGIKRLFNETEDEQKMLTAVDETPILWELTEVFVEKNMNTDNTGNPSETQSAQKSIEAAQTPADQSSSKEAVYDDESAFEIGLTKTPPEELQNGGDVETQSTPTEAISEKSEFEDVYEDFDIEELDMYSDVSMEDESMEALCVDDSSKSSSIESFINDEEFRNKMNEMIARLEKATDEVLQQETNASCPESSDTMGSTAMGITEQNRTKNRSALNSDTSTRTSESSDVENIMMGYEGDDEDSVKQEGKRARKSKHGQKKNYKGKRARKLRHKPKKNYKGNRARKLFHGQKKCYKGNQARMLFNGPKKIFEANDGSEEYVSGKKQFMSKLKKVNGKLYLSLA